MRLEKYMDKDILMENIFHKMIKKISRKPLKAIHKMLRDSWLEFAEIIKSNGLEKQFLSLISKHIGVHYHSIDQLQKISKPTTRLMESRMDEDFKHFMELIKGEGWPALSFYPALQIWLTIDAMITKSAIESMDIKKIAIYGILWILMISGKFVKEYKKWKEENTEEWRAEGGRRNPFGFMKKKDPENRPGSPVTTVQRTQIDFLRSH